MDEGVGVKRGIDRQHQVAVPHRRSGMGDRGASQGDRLDAGMPEFARRSPFIIELANLGAQGKRCPPRRLVIDVGQCRIGVVRGSANAAAEDPPACLGA